MPPVGSVIQHQIDADIRITIAEVEAFLVNEAALLDEWRLDEWTKLLADDVYYFVPALDAPDADFKDALFLIADDSKMLRSRVRQLQGNNVWAETPRSRTRRLVTNFRILSQEGEEARVTANFAVWRFQNEGSDTFVGRYVNRLIRDSTGQLLFRERKAILDHETLRPHGRLSIIL